jgi:hypothetical protein
MIADRTNDERRIQRARLNNFPFSAEEMLGLCNRLIDGPGFPQALANWDGFEVSLKYYTDDQFFSFWRRYLEEVIVKIARQTSYERQMQGVVRQLLVEADWQGAYSGIVDNGFLEKPAIWQYMVEKVEMFALVPLDTYPELLRRRLFMSVLTYRVLFELGAALFDLNPALRLNIDVFRTYRDNLVMKQLVITNGGFDIVDNNPQDGSAFVDFVIENIQPLFLKYAAIKSEMVEAIVSRRFDRQTFIKNVNAIEEEWKNWRLFYEQKNT